MLKLKVPRNEYGPYELLIEDKNRDYPSNTVRRDGCLVEYPSTEGFARQRVLLMHNIFWNTDVRYKDVEWE